ncbi:MAG: BrnT family toxin [Hyphomicrobiales bacterium]|nr:BrnT family toxin [Hyphomicrobiales bacterium]
MEGDDFEWDDAKAARNEANHGVSFETAIRVFKDPFAIERVDDRKDYGEVRFSILGLVDGRLLYVAYTLRNGTIRIISARGAEPNERRQYHEDNT